MRHASDINESAKAQKTIVKRAPLVVFLVGAFFSAIFVLLVIKYILTSIEKLTSKMEDVAVKNVNRALKEAKKAAEDNHIASKELSKNSLSIGSAVDSEARFIQQTHDLVGQINSIIADTT